MSWLFSSPVSFMALCKRRRMLSTFEMIDIDCPVTLSQMIVALHPVLFWMFFVKGSSAMLPTNSHTYPSPCVPCVRHRSHVDSSWFRLVQRVRMTLRTQFTGTEHRCVTVSDFSSSHQSRRKSRIRRLSLIFATFDISISSSVFFSVRCRFARSSSSSVSRGMVLHLSHPPDIAVC